MQPITVYQKPTCSTCRNVIKLLETQKLPFTAINYYEKPFTTNLLTTLLKKGGLKALDVLRTKEEIYKTLNLRTEPRSEKEMIDLMVQHPDLIQRPLVEIGDTVILARPPERLSTALKA
ncbi:MAG: arsenate reductase [Nitrospirales bacterium]|nr:arsenate reductase [Nitrospirales bacterium]